MTTGPAGHPGLDQLDELLDLGADSSTPGADEFADLRAHVESCRHCTDELEGLRQVRAMLASARDETPMPDVVAQQLATAMLREGGYRVTGMVPPHEQLPFDDSPPVFDVPPWGDLDADDPHARHDPHDLPSNVTPLRRARRPLVWLGAAAAAVLAVGVGGGVIAKQFTQSTASTSVADGAGSAPSLAEAVPGKSTGAATEHTFPTESLAVSNDLGDLDPASLPSAVSGVPVSRGNTRLASCASSLALTPSAEYTARWQGADAFVFVTETPQGRQVTVVDAECKAGAGGGFRYDQP